MRSTTKKNLCPVSRGSDILAFSSMTRQDKTRSEDMRQEMNPIEKISSGSDRASILCLNSTIITDHLLSHFLSSLLRQIKE